MKLSESQLQTILHALHVAVDTFEQDSIRMRKDGNDRLAHQFNRQAKETRTLADLCEEYELSFTTPPRQPCGCDGETYTCSLHAQLRVPCASVSALLAELAFLQALKDCKVEQGHIDAAEKLVASLAITARDRILAVSTVTRLAFGDRVPFDSQVSLEVD